MIIQKNPSRTLRRPLALAASFVAPAIALAAFAGPASAGTGPSFVSYECSDSGDVDGPFLVVDVPDKKIDLLSDPEALAGSKADVLVFSGDVVDEYLEEEELTPYAMEEGVDRGDSATIEVGTGLYTVVLDFPPGYKELAPTASPNVDLLEIVAVSCGKKPNIKIDVVTPPLPKTGGDSDLALVIAPIAVLAGGALLALRRRFAAA